MARPGLKLTVTVAGKRKTFESIEAAAKYFKIPYVTLYQRLFVMEWKPSKAVHTPVRKKAKNKKNLKLKPKWYGQKKAVKKKIVKRKTKK